MTASLRTSCEFSRRQRDSWRAQAVKQEVIRRGSSWWAGEQRGWLPPTCCSESGIAWVETETLRSLWSVQISWDTLIRSLIVMSGDPPGGEWQGRGPHPHTLRGRLVRRPGGHEVPGEEETSNHQWSRIHLSLTCSDWVLIFKIFEYLGVPLTEFTHVSHTRESYVWLNGKYYNADDVGLYAESLDLPPRSERKMMEIYKMFNITKVPRDRKGNLLNPMGLCYQILDKNVDLRKMCINDVWVLEVYSFITKFNELQVTSKVLDWCVEQSGSWSQFDQSLGHCWHAESLLWLLCVWVHHRQ